MNIIVAIKVVYDDRDITVNPDGSLDYSVAKPVVSMYDLNAIEAAAQLATKIGDCKVTAISIGTDIAGDSKLKKNILARGADELLLVANDDAAGLDSHQTALALSALVKQLESFDLIICGDGSADEYAQQSDVQLAALLDIPMVNGVISLDVSGNSIKATRMLEDVVETCELPLPALVSVTPEIALPGIPSMKDILAAGKKPQTTVDLPDAGAASFAISAIAAPQTSKRALKVFDASKDGDMQAFVAAVKDVL
jgi:electron transfer flavoprotein beta subunit